MAGIGETLSERAGPLPVWAWAALGTGALTAFLFYRKKKQAQAQAAQQAAAQSQNASDLGTVPISNLTTQAQPMPLTLGDTFVNASAPNVPPPDNPITSTTGVPGTTLISGNPPAPPPDPTTIPQASAGQTPGTG